MSDLKTLYQEVILDHSRRPRNFGTLEDASRADGSNPLCGDELTLYVDVGECQGTPRITSFTANPTTIQLEFVSNPLIFGTDDYYEGDFRAFDAAGTSDSQIISLDGLNWNGGINTPLRGVVTSDGSKAYYGNRNQPAVLTIDLLTFEVTIGDSLIDGGNPIAFDQTGDIGFVRAVAMSQDERFLYASLVTGAHTYECAISKTAGGTGTLEVVKIDLEDMSVAGRLVVVDEVDEAMLKEVSLSADGSRGAVAVRVYDPSYGAPVADVHGKIYAFDTTSMTLVPGPAGDGFDVDSIGVRVDAAAISPDGSTVYFHAAESLGDLHNLLLQTLDLTTGEVLAVPDGPERESHTTDLKVGPDGRIYWVTSEELNIFDPSDGSWTQPANAALESERGEAAPFTPWSVEFQGDGYYAIDHNRERASRHLIEDDSAVVAPADPSVPEGWINLPDLDESHAELVTPF